jgi:hypothetical protein
MEILGYRKATKNVPACGAQCYRSDDVFCFVVSMKIDIIIPVPVQIDQTIIKFHTLNKELKVILDRIYLVHYFRFVLTELLLELNFQLVHRWSPYMLFLFLKQLLYHQSFFCKPRLKTRLQFKCKNSRSTSSYWHAFLFSLSRTFHLLTRLTRFPYIVISVCSKFNSENEWTLSSFHFILIQIPSITWSNNASPSSLEKKFGHHFNVEWISIFISSNFGVSLNSNLFF